MLKRLMSVLLAAALIFAAFGVITASAEDAEELAGTGADADIAVTGGMLWVSTHVCGDYEYGLDEDGNAHITKYSGSDENIVIPSELDGNPVIEIFWGTFMDREITSVTIPDTVLTIDSDAFRNCKKLVTVVMSKSIKRIWNDAFNGCELLTDIDLPDSLTEVGGGAFNDTLWFTLQPNGVVYAGAVAYALKGSAPETVTIKNGTVAVANSMFENNNDIVSVKLPDSLLSIEYDAFKNCDSLGSIDFPSSLISIGTSAFEDCDALTSVALPASLNELGDRVFHYCDNLTTLTIDPANPVFDSRDNCNAIIRKSDNKLLMAINTSTIPNGVETIGRDAFMRNAVLVDLVIPDSVRVIEGQAFWGCWNLETVRFPSKLESVGDRAFAYCYELADIQLPDTVKHICRNSFEGTAWENNLPTGMIYFGTVAFGYKHTNGDQTEWPSSIAIREGTKYIAEEAFRDNDLVSAVSLPGSLLEIGYAAFNDCDGITTVNIPEGVTTIGDGVFADCDKLTSANIPSTVTSLDWSTFSGDKSLKSITLAEGLTVIPNWMFNDCSSLESIEIPATVTEIGQSAFEGCTALISATVPDSVATIRYNAFKSCDKLTTLRLGTGLTEVSSTAFDNCDITYLFINDMDTFWVCLPAMSGFNYRHVFLNGKPIYELNVPDSIVKIPLKAFNEWSDLKKVTLNDSLIGIASEAFARCDGLTEIYIPANVSSISVDAFKDCKALTSIKVDKNNKTFDSRGNCNAVINTEANVLHIGCPGTYIPDTVTAINSRAFEYCSALTEIRIPSSVKIIGNRAFTGSGLTKIVLPESVTNINGAFRECEELKDIAIGNPNLSLNNSELGIYEYWESEIIDNVLHIYKAVKKYDGIVIYGHEGSTAQSYADSNGFTFKPWSTRPAEPPEVIPAILGDADGSGEVDAVDATIIQRSVTMIPVPFSEEQLMTADVDGDGDLTIVDATFIQRYSTRVAIPYAIGEAI